MNRKSCLFARCAAVCLIAVLVSASAAARTVYDAGKAMRENLASSSPTSESFTDSKGGKWSYYFSNENGTPNTEVTLKCNGQKAYNDGYINGFDGSRSLRRRMQSEADKLVVLSQATSRTDQTTSGVVCCHIVCIGG